MFLSICVLLSALNPSLSTLADASSSVADPVLGDWSGKECNADECKPIALHFERYAKKGGMLVMYYDNPQMKFLRFGPMPVQRDGDGVTNEYFQLQLSADRSALDGKKAFDGHALPVILRRGNLPTAQRADAPTARIAAPVWTFETGGAVWSSPSVADGVAYFGSMDKSIYALDVHSGTPRWHFATAGAVMAQPTVEKTHLYVSSDDGFIYKLDRGSGKLVWKFDAHGSAPREFPNMSVAKWELSASAPTISGGVVYVGSADKRLYAIDAETGVERWHFETKDKVFSTPAVADGRVFIGSFDHNVYALDAKTGRMIWKLDTLEPIVSSPVVFDKTVYIGSRSSDLFALDAATGAKRWDFFYWSSWVESSAQIRQGTLYIGSSDYQQAFALDAKTGKEKWRRDLGGSVWTTPAISDSRVYVGTTGMPGYFVDPHGGFFALDRATGKIVWRFAMPAGENGAAYGVASSPALSDGLVLFGGLDGKFYALRAD
jgi:eukaryotic-like serine/threonine-protein kinase